MKRFIAIIALGVGLQICAWGCASGEAVSPIERAVDVSQGKIEGGLAKGKQNADVVRGVFLTVRYNPAGCDVPAFEVFTHERWTRVYFDGDAEIMVALQDFENGSRILSDTSYLEVSGKISGRRRNDAGVRYPIFDISDLRKPSVANGRARAGAEPFERFDEPRACL